MKEIIHNDWQTVLADQFQAPYYLKLREFLKQESVSYTHLTLPTT